MKKIFLFLLLTASLSTYSQTDEDDGMIELPTQEKPQEKIREIGKHYFEDQFYLALSYDYLAAKASNVVQHNLSRGVHLGFLKDLPINKERNIGFAVGLGYANDLIYNNMQVSKVGDELSYEIIERLGENGISRNYFQTHTLELPIEFRWRTSTAEKTKFWRIYTGFKVGYILDAISLTKKDGITAYFDNKDLEKEWHFKIFTAFGYNAINFFVQYDMTPFYKNVSTTDGVSLKSSVLQMGLIFYIL